jgi:hypothetical protein
VSSTPPIRVVLGRHAEVRRRRQPSGTTYVTVKLWGDDHDDSSDVAASGTRGSFA